MLYERQERRAWLVPAIEIMVLLLRVRYHGKGANIPCSMPPWQIYGQAAKRMITESQCQVLYERTSFSNKACLIRDAILDIWSLLERMMERDGMIKAAPGVAVHGTACGRLFGWEFIALAGEKSFRQKEQILEKSHGGWLDLINNVDAVVLFANGFGDVIKPIDNILRLCPIWESLPKSKDYLAVGCPMLEFLFREAGSRKTHRYLTSRHLQWELGSILFGQCENIVGCTCDRLQQLVYDAKTTFGQIRCPGSLPENGCVVFGRVHHPVIPVKDRQVKRRAFYSIPNDPIQDVIPSRSRSPYKIVRSSATPDRDRGNNLDGDGTDIEDTDDSVWSSVKQGKNTAFACPMSSRKRRRSTHDQQLSDSIADLNGQERRHTFRREALSRFPMPKTIVEPTHLGDENRLLENDEIYPTYRDALLEAKGSPTEAPKVLRHKVKFNHHVQIPEWYFQECSLEITQERGNREEPISASSSQGKRWGTLGNGKDRP